MSSQNSQNQSPPNPPASGPAWNAILALVIGINKYTSRKYSSLEGAVADANLFENFLKNSLNVPAANITNLRNEQASRASILSAFNSLRDNPTYKKDEAAIIIFYAGHGACTPVPEEWERKGYIAGNGRIEMLCPSDIGCPVNGEESVIEGIPDRKISVLLNQISNAKGNNITLILDCCSSAGMDRAVDFEESGKYTIRQISPPPFEHDTYQDLFNLPSNASGERSSNIPAGFSGTHNESHVLLAACGQEQKAREDKNRGVFTSRLMEILTDGSENISTLTYTSLIDKINLKMPELQTPHCGGKEINRRLFRKLEPDAHRSFILAKCESSKIILKAGDAQGIAPGFRMAAYAYNFKETSNTPKNPCLGFLTVSKVNNDKVSCELQIASDTEKFPLPPLFYCVIDRLASQNIALYCENRVWLESVFPPEESITIVDDVTHCDLQLTVMDKKVHFARYHDLVTPHIGPRIIHTVDVGKEQVIRNVVKSSLHFYYHLTRTTPLSSRKLLMELKKLKEETNDDFDTVYTPIGENLIVDEPARIIVDDAYLGMKIVNQTSQSLYPHVFYFDPTHISIVEWYMSPFGAGLGTVDAPLPPKSTLTLGYGDGGVSPWEFMLRDGDKKDIGFFKLFFSTNPGDFSSILQESPFSSGQARAGEKAKIVGVSKMWGTKLVTVIQVDS